MDDKRITILCGHYGSGKSNLAVNLALDLKKRHTRVALADLDIVNPYFRSADSREYLQTQGIRLIASDFVNTNLDVPALPPEMYTLCDDKTSHAVIDLGGDDRGALALGRLRERLLEENDYAMLFVLNAYRPLTRTPQEAMEVIAEIEAAGGIPVTGLINNSNLGRETDEQTVLDSLPFANEVSHLSQLPIVATAVHRDLYEGLSSEIPDLFALTLQNNVPI